MCVIIYKPKGEFLPNSRIIKACGMANRHGFGFATPTKYFKSLNFEAFRHELEKVRYDEPCIIHFRLATHGSIKKANCHPFRRGDVVFAHNGILDIEPYRDMTDSETAFRFHLYPVIRQYGLQSDETDKAVSEVIGGSRFAIMQGEEVRLFGIYEEINGCYYSNLRFFHYLYF